MSGQLFPTAKAAAYSGPLAIEHVPTVDRCPRCAATIHEQTVQQDALLRHGGGGATRRQVTRSCPECHWFTTVEISDERPPSSPEDQG